MCVAIYKDSGVKSPSMETFKKCWDANPDGAGYAWVRKDGKIEWRKGFMEFAEFAESLAKLGKLDERQMLFHFRIGTSGGNIPANTHPFPISANPDDLRKLSGVADAVLMHNGVLPFKGREKTLSDTMELALRIAESGATPKGAVKLIEDMTHDRILVMWKGGGVQGIGGWEKEDGVWYSNLTWKVKRTWFRGGMRDDECEWPTQDIEAWLPSEKEIKAAALQIYGDNSPESVYSTRKMMEDFVRRYYYFDMIEFLYDFGIDIENESELMERYG